MCIIPKRWSFHGVTDAESCLLFGPVVSYFSYLSLCEHFQELHWCSQELSRRMKSFYISILLLCASWDHTWQGRAQFHVSYGLFPTLQKGLDTPTVPSRNVPGLPWVLVDPSLWWDLAGKSQTRKRTNQDNVGIREFLNSTAREVPWHCSNFPGPSIILLRHRGFAPENVHVMEVAITLYKGLSCYLMTGITVFESFFGNLNTQGYICSFLQDCSVGQFWMR